MLSDVSKNGSEVYDFIFKLDRRIGYLEKDLSFIEGKIDSVDFSRRDVYNRLSLELDSEKADIEEIKEIVKFLKLSMLKVSSEMKDIVKKNQYESLSKMVDEIPFDELITRKELDKNE